MNRLEHPHELQAHEFMSGDLILWYDQHENKPLPVPGVVIRQESPDSVLIKARVEGAMREVHVNSKELINR